MSTTELVHFVGFGLIYALLATVATIAALRVIGRPLPVRWWPAMGLTTFFLSLTHHPFPDPEELDCTEGGEPPLLVPLQFFGSVLRRWERDASLSTWVHDLTISSAAMNLFLCMAIGMALAPCMRHMRHVALFAVALSGLVETSQVTGIFGLYPCPYRQFDVDDLILNITGIVIGYVLMRWIGGPTRVKPS